MAKTVADYVRYLLLLAIKRVATLFYRAEVKWLTPQPDWNDVKVLALLNHTSLFEWLYAVAAPPGLLRRIGSHAVVPIAETTHSRPFVGRFLDSLAPHFVSITREADHTWQAVLDRLGDDHLVAILPEGRMMRANGLDKHGKPMTVRGGIADILRATSGGVMLVAYLGGLHHVQVPGQLLPKPFKTLRVSFEAIDIELYKANMGVELDSPQFKNLVKHDLEYRRDHYCPTAGRDTAPLSPRPPSLPESAAPAAAAGSAQASPASPPRMA